MGNFEKCLGIIGSIIALITFVLSLLNWFGLNVAIDASIPNRRIAGAILVIYSFFASYGSVEVILMRERQNGRIFLLWVMLIFSYVFGFLFLLEKCLPVLALPPNGGILVCFGAGFCNWGVFYSQYFWDKLYPNGFSFFSWFFGMFVTLRHSFLLLMHGFGVMMLFSLLY